jgi:hypothetical protein
MGVIAVSKVRPGPYMAISYSHEATKKLTMWSRMATMRNRMSALEIGAVQEDGNNSPPDTHWCTPVAYKDNLDSLVSQR